MIGDSLVDNDTYVYNGKTYTWDGTEWRTNETLILVGNTSGGVSANSTHLTVGNSSVNTSMNTTSFGVNGHPVSGIKAWALVTGTAIVASQGFDNLSAGILYFSTPMSSANNFAVLATSGDPGSVAIESQINRTANSIIVVNISVGNTPVQVTSNYSVAVIGE